MDSHGAAATLITSIPFCSFDIFFSPPGPSLCLHSAISSYHTLYRLLLFSLGLGPQWTTSAHHRLFNLPKPIYSHLYNVFVHFCSFAALLPADLLLLLLLPLTRRLTDLDVLLLFFARKSGATRCFCSPATCKQLITIIVCVF